MMKTPSHFFMNLNREQNKLHAKMETTRANNTRGPLNEISLPKDLIGNINMEETKNLFVGMCFYARLGFLQPPCCLQCSYENSENTDETKTNETNQSCLKPVVWRINASSSHLLHPDKLKGNLIVIPCSTARSLLRGKVVDGKRWDRKQHLLVDEGECKKTRS